MDNGLPTKVLLIEDDKAMCETLKLVLEPDTFEVYEVNSGSAGVEAARSLKPDVIILDLLMPGMDGWEATRAIRAFSRIPILVLSAVSKPDMVTKALDAGADEYLIKPVPSSVLVAHLKRLARRARAELATKSPKKQRLRL
ncbi:MAG: response regulator [Anaerolineales bacterium]|nr:response regulator [Anaerolineales bacterium]